MTSNLAFSVHLNKGIKQEPTEGATKQPETIQNSIQVQNSSALSCISLEVKTDCEIQSLTGVPFLKLFDSIVDYVSRVLRTDSYVTPERSVLLTLMRLRLDVPFTALAGLFGVPESKCRLTFYSTLPCLAAFLKKYILWPQDYETSDCNNFRPTKLIFDYFEVVTGDQSCSFCKELIVNEAKKHTLKILIGITFSGLIAYIGEPLCGFAPDKSLLMQSQILEKLNPEKDAVLVPKVTSIKKECQKLNIPAFTIDSQNKNSEDTKSKTVNNAEVENINVLVHSMVLRIKEFKILNSIIPDDLLSEMAYILSIVGALTNQTV